MVRCRWSRRIRRSGRIVFWRIRKKEDSEWDILSSGTTCREEENVKYRYLAIVESGVQDNDIKVTYLRSLDSSRKKFKIQENDTSYICYDQVFDILKTPTVKLNGGRAYYEFDYRCQWKIVNKDCSILNISFCFVTQILLIKCNDNMSIFKK